MDGLEMEAAKREVYEVEYQLRPDAVIPIKNVRDFDPQRIGEYIANLKTKFGDGLTTRVILDDATHNKSSPIRKHLEWDDKVAAYEHRLNQVRAIRRSLEIVPREGSNEMPKPAFVPIRDRKRFTIYSHTEVLTNLDLQNRMVNELSGELVALIHRFERHSVLAHEIERLKEITFGLKSRIVEKQD